MLAQNFKSAAELEITEPQKEALMKTLVLLETGKLQHFDVDRIKDFCTDGIQFSGHFNMGTFNRRHECGTVACIAGTASLISGVKFCGELDRPDALQELFFADEFGGALTDITPAQAATALRSYLTTGNANWHEAIA